MVRLPEEVRHPEENRERGACPQPTAARQAEAAVEEAAAGKGAEQEQHEILVLEPEAGDEADEQPLPLVAAAEDAGHEQHHRDPDENVERRRREQMADCHRRARGSSRERGDRLAGATRTELAGDERDEDDDDRDRDGRYHAQSAGVFAEGRFRQPAQQRRQRRLIVVPPGRMLRGDAEVELVAVVAVAVRGRDEQRELGRRDGKNERPGDGGTAAIHWWTISREATAWLSRSPAAPSPRHVRRCGPARDRSQRRGSARDRGRRAGRRWSPARSPCAARRGAGRSRRRSLPGRRGTIRLPASIVSSPEPTT